MENDERYELVRAPSVDLKETAVSPGPPDVYWWTDYRPWLLYKGVIVENSLGVVFHFVIGDN